MFAVKPRHVRGTKRAIIGIGTLTRSAIAAASVLALTLVGGVLFPVSLWAGTLTLSWDEPSTNSDGSALTDLAGYKLYCGPTAGNYTLVQDVGRPASCGSTFPSQTCSVVVANLTSGTYYCVVTAYDSQSPANESTKSNEVIKVLEMMAPSRITTLK